MSRIHVTAVLAFSALVFPVSFACAQQVFSGAAGADTASQGSATGKNVPQCQGAPGGSRMRQRDRGGCQEIAEAVAKSEQQINISLEAPQSNEPLLCEATTSTEYSQRNTVARVTGTVNITNCTAGSAGTFDVVARVRDDSAEIKPIEFHETWQYDDARAVSFNKDYPIGENVELVNVRVRNMKCTCAAAPETLAPEAAATATAPTN